MDLGLLLTSQLYWISYSIFVAKALSLKSTLQNFNQKIEIIRNHIEWSIKIASQQI